MTANEIAETCFADGAIGRLRSGQESSANTPIEGFPIPAHALAPQKFPRQLSTRECGFVLTTYILILARIGRLLVQRKPFPEPRSNVLHCRSMMRRSQVRPRELAPPVVFCESLIALTAAKRGDVAIIEFPFADDRRSYSCFCSSKIRHLSRWRPWRGAEAITFHSRARAKNPLAQRRLLRVARQGRP